MIAFRVTPASKEGVEVEGVEKEGGTIEATRAFVSTRGYSARSWALLHQTEPVLMATMVVN